MSWRWTIVRYLCWFDQPKHQIGLFDFVSMHSEFTFATKWQSTQFFLFFLEHKNYLRRNYASTMERNRAVFQNVKKACGHFQCIGYNKHMNGWGLRGRRLNIDNRKEKDFAISMPTSAIFPAQNVISVRYKNVIMFKPVFRESLSFSYLLRLTLQA